MSATLPASGAASPPVVLAQRYRLDRRLAQGGMAEVWVATDLSLTRQVAVKLLKPSLAADPVVAERFRREAIAVAQLNHPNIVSVYDAIEDVSGDRRRQAVVMELVSGKSLRQLLDEQRRLSPMLTIHIGTGVAAALDCAHRAHLVHRDVKPGNILVTPDGKVLLTDFGIAKGIDDGDDLTSPNIMMGTAKYLSPEQVRGSRLDGRADIYSLGLVLYECLAGRVPFLGETDADTALARLNRDPTDLARLRSTLPEGLAAAIHRMLARRPDDRYASGAEVRDELQRIARQPSPDLTEGAGSRGFTPPTATRPPASRPTPARPTPPPPQRAPAGRHDAPRPNVRPANGRPAPTPAAGTRRHRTPPGGGTPRPGRPAGPARVADRTPPRAERPASRPNRRYEHRSGPTLVIVGALLVTALAVGSVLWSTLRSGGNPLDPAVTAAPSLLPISPSAPPAAPTIAAIRTYDPEGDGEERDDLLPLLTDGDPATAWTTVCYADRFLGSKDGVGVVVDLGSAVSASLRVTVLSAPSQVRVYAANGELPSGFADWGSPVANFDDTSAAVVDVVTTGRWILVAFAELGDDTECTSNPYRGAIGEIVLLTEPAQ